jgi:hypothetical protein
MTILTDWKFTLSADDVLRGQGADPETVRTKKPALLKAASAALHAGFTKLRPAAVIQKAKVIEHRHDRIRLKGGKELTGPLVAHHLAGAEQVILAVCTIGPELEKLASSWMDENPLLGLALDGLGNAAVEKVAQQVCAHIAERAQAKGLQASTPLSPGEPGWPVEVGQPQIFALLDPSKAGVTLTSGGMMVPKKSISFVVGLGPEMAQTDTCEVCSLKETCRYRHA